MSINFIPKQNTYSNLGAFRYWCQKVLPLVYDDSLSYYELLCKVVNYLNETIENVDLMGDDIQKLYTAYEELHNFVNGYFTNLDVQHEINNKLDSMAENGSLSVLIQPLFDVYKREIEGIVAEQNAEIDVLKGRMNAYTKLGEGNTTGDAELADARVDYTGKEWGNVGEHVREVSSQLSEQIENIPERIFVDGRPAKTATQFVGVLEKATETKGAFYNGNGGFLEETSSWDYFTLPVKQGEKYRVCTFCVSNAYAVTIHKANGEIIAKYPNEPNGSVVDIIFEIPDGASYIIANQNNTAFNIILETEGEFYDFSSALREVTIEDYVKEQKYDDVKDNATRGANQFISRSGEILEINGWNTYELPVTTGETYKVKTAYVSAAVMYALVYSDGNITVYPNIEPTSEKIEEVLLNIPQAATRLIVNENPSVISAVIEKQTDDVHFKKISVNADYLYGKKLVACGDSITEAINPNGGYFKNYGEIVAERNGMLFVNDGIGGSTMTNIGSGKSFTEGRYLNHTDFDYLTLWFGWNDGAYAELGTIEDETDTTFYGAYKKVLKHYMTTYPTKKIGVIVPYMGQEKYKNAVRELSKMYGVPCLDLADGNKCSIIWGFDNEVQLARRNALTYDSTHPNQEGYYFIATMFENFLRSL